MTWEELVVVVDQMQDDVDEYSLDQWAKDVDKHIDWLRAQTEFERRAREHRNL